MSNNNQFVSANSGDRGAAGGGGIAIFVMGANGSGKTSFINLAGGLNLRVGIGCRISSTIEAAQPFEIDGRRVFLIEAPGFDDVTPTENAGVLDEIVAFLASMHENEKIILSGVIYLHRISDFRGESISRNFRMFRALCGDDALRNAIILTNVWDEVHEEVGEARERELATMVTFFKSALDGGAQLLRHTRTVESAHNALRHLIYNDPLPLRIQRELVYDKMSIPCTAAGRELNRQSQNPADQNIERAEFEERLRNMAEAARIREGTQAEHEGRIRALEQRLEQLLSSSAAERANMQRQISSLQQWRGLFSVIGGASEGSLDS